MDHSLAIDGFGIRLRPVLMRDAEFIVRLRNMSHVRGHVGDSATTVEAQREWINSYLQRPGDAYFMIEDLRQSPIGTIGLYEIKECSAEWGRWIILPDVPAALPSAVLIHDLAFDVLGLGELNGCVVSTNKTVLSFHRRFGAEETGVQYKARQIGGTWVDLVWFRVLKHSWSELRPRLLPLAQAAERSIKNAISSRILG